MEYKVESVIWKTMTIAGVSASANAISLNLENGPSAPLLLYELLAIGCIAMGLLMWYKHFAGIKF